MKCDTCKMKRVCDELERMGKVPKHEKCRCYTPTKPITNADKIRSMTDEELAVLLANTEANFPPNFPNGVSVKLCTTAWLDWLKQGAKE